MATILHLDMDAFFASVEQHDDPQLKGRPVIIGRDLRGVVSAASYEARKFGVHSAMPVAEARRRCPHGVFLPGNRHRYREVSHVVMATLSAISPLVEPASIDEAYVDITGTETLFGPPEVLGRRLKEMIRQATGLSCSVGIAPVKFIAKIASDYDKPDGLTLVAPEAVAAFLADLPVGKIPGVGKRAQATLSRLGIRVTGDILRYPPDFWQRHGGKWGLELYARANGQGSDIVRPDREAKSVSAENTFAADTADRQRLMDWLLYQSERIGRELRQENQRGRTITLKIKFNDFRQITRSRTLPEPTNSDAAIFAAARGLLDAEPLPKAVRLIGVGVSNFGQEARQLSLFASSDEARQHRDGKIDAALDTIRDKFGRTAIVRGRLFDFARKADGKEAKETGHSQTSGRTPGSAPVKKD